MGVRIGKIVRILAFRYRIGGVVPVAIAEEVARTIEQVYGYKNPPIIPNGIPTDEYSPNPEQRVQFRATHGVEPEAIVIVHVGRFVGLKNHALLLQAFAQLQSSQPLYLWLVGDGELRPQTEQIAQELGIADRVRFWGVRSDVADILNAADIFTLPSQYEGNPMAVMEAMAAGLPIVATAVGGIPELVAHGVSGLLVPNDDVAALRKALQHLIDAPEARHAMGQAALQRARTDSDIRHTVRQYEGALCTDLLQRTKARVKPPQQFFAATPHERFQHARRFANEPPKFTPVRPPKGFVEFSEFIPPQLATVINQYHPTQTRVPLNLW